MRPPRKEPVRFAIAFAESSPGQPAGLSLCNSRHWRNSAVPKETLSTYADVLAWADVKGIGTPAERAALAALAVAQPHAANAELHRVIALREAIATTFATKARGERVPAAALQELDAHVHEALAKLRLRNDGAHPELALACDALASPRWHAALSAAALLVSPSAERVRQCADERGCGWLFLDTTRNGSRRYCFSSECGNRARQLRYRARHHDAAATAPRTAPA